MYINDLKVEDGIDEVADNKIVMAETTAYIEKIKADFLKEVWYKLTDDIEKWMYERYDNVKMKYFDELITMLVGEHRWGANEAKVNEWLTSLGYDSCKLRKKIYEENKDMINKAIADDAIYEYLDRNFGNKYFGEWNFKDITTNYPQTDIVRKFMGVLMAKEGFPEYVTSVLDKGILEKKAYLDQLKQEIASIEASIKKLEDN
jgi:hypothetical protein